MKKSSLVSKQLLLDFASGDLPQAFSSVTAWTNTQSRDFLRKKSRHGFAGKSFLKLITGGYKPH